MSTAEARGEERRPRVVAIERLTRLVPAWTDLPIHERGDGGLGSAIVMESIRRWRTIDHLVLCAMGRDPSSIEPALRAVLLAGVAQIAFMDEPAHAVVDESVEWSKGAIRPGAGRLVNAVLRRIAGWCAERFPMPERWWNHRDLVPRADGSAIRLPEPLMPPALESRLAISTSHADGLVQRWLDRYGVESAARLAAHGIMHAPRLVADPRGSLARHGSARPHRSRGFVVWTGTLAALRDEMARDPSLRVQDPGSARAVDRTADLAPKRIVDACAGRGTKTRQLAELHADAEIVAADRDPVRHAALTAAFAGHPRVRVVAPDALTAIRGVDLLVLDVPCSNTGVLARRPEAKARFDDRRIGSLVQVQRSIVEAHRPMLADSGRLLYATCSVEAEENEQMVSWIERVVGRAGRLEVRLPEGAPGGDPASYADGGASAIF